MVNQNEIVPSLTDELGEILKDVLKKLPHDILGKMIDKKLAVGGQAIPAEAKAALIQHILSGAGGEFNWPDENGGDATISLSLSFDETDLAEIDAIQARLGKEIPKAIFEELDRQIEQLFKSLKAKWKQESALQTQDAAGFKERLHQRWGKGIELLRMLLTMSRETAGEELKRYHQATPAEVDIKFMLLVRLHARACQVTEEIICLLEGGLAEGAMARWRTLHEIAVVSAVLADGDRDLAERFILHETVEDWDQLKERRQAWPTKAPSKAHARRESDLKAQYDALIAKYEKPFGSPYGWAAGYLNNKKPTFKDLQRQAKKAIERSHYKLASFNVHAGASGTLNRLSGMGESRHLLAGRSNAGLAEPGRNTAFSLAQINGTLVGTPRTIEDIMAMKTLIAVRDAIPRAFDRADRKLRRDEAAMARS
jgi:hypothetical protein